MKKLVIYITVIMVLTSCEDFVTQEPVDQILTAEAIVDGVSADQAVLGAYSRMQLANLYGNNIFLYSGVLSDELQHSGSFPTIAEMDINDVGSSNISTDNMWQTGYTTIFQVNNILEILEGGVGLPGLSDSIQMQYIGEARFIRALMHFTIANFYGNIPLVETTDVAVNNSIGQTGQAAIYSWVIAEAQAAQVELANVPKSQYRATAWAAKALEARTQLYAGNASAAATIADDIIENGPFSLEADYADLFEPAARSDEIIFSIFYSATDMSGIPFQLLPTGRFEMAVGGGLVESHGEDPRALWELNEADAQGRSNVTKYSDIITQTDNSIVFRLAEMYLIRAEGGNTPVADINALRMRAGADLYTGVGVLADVLDERLIELSFEGHRWFDISRTGQAVTIMASVPRSNFVATDALLPIPQRDLNINKNLTQNPGY